MTSEIGDAHPHGREDRHLAIFEKDHLASVGKHRRNIGGNEIFPLPLADNQRRTELGGDHFVRLRGAENRHRVGSLNLAESQTYGSFEITALLEVFFNQVGDNFSIGLRTEIVSHPLQTFFQFQVVFDDAIMHHHNTPRPVRVGIDLRWPPVGRPAGVADATGAGCRLVLENLFQIDQLPFGAADLRLTAVEGADPGRVIAAVFQSPQAVDNDR